MNIDNGIKEPTCGYQNCNTSQIMIFDGYVCQGERIFVYLSDYLDHSEPYGTRAILPRYDGCCMVYGPKWYQKR